MMFELLQGQPYSFNYSILDDKTGITHSRDESSDDEGVIRGTYEVRKYHFNVKSETKSRCLKQNTKTQTNLALKAPSIECFLINVVTLSLIDHN